MAYSHTWIFNRQMGNLSSGDETSIILALLEKLKEVEKETGKFFTQNKVQSISSVTGADNKKKNLFYLFNLK